jgi:hypothetical protein
MAGPNAFYLDKHPFQMGKCEMAWRRKPILATHLNVEDCLKIWYSKIKHSWEEPAACL